MRLGSCQRGQETLQAVLVLSFVMIPVLFATLELGGLLHAWMGLQAAAAVGARYAGEVGEDDMFVRLRIHDQLRDAGVDPATCTVDVTPTYAAWHDPITVRLATQRRVGVPFMFERDVQLQATFTARSEVNR